MAQTAAAQLRTSTERGAGSRPRGRLGAIVVLIYVALSLLLFAPALPYLGSQIQGGFDGYLFTWWVSYLPWSIGHAHNPLVTDLLAYPQGVNAMWNTSMPAVGLIMSPVTLLGGPILAYNLTLLLSPVLSAAAAYWAGRRFGFGPLAAAVAGLIYGFSPYVVGQAGYGHPNLGLSWFPPVALILGRQILLTQEGAWWKPGLWLGLATAVELLTSEEMTLTTVLVAVIGLVLLLLAGLRRPAEITRRLGYAARGLAVAAVTAGVLCTWPLVTQFFGPQQVHGVIQTPNVYVNDAVHFVAPTLVEQFDPFGLEHFTAHTSGNALESAGYLGPVLIALLAWIVVRHWRVPLVAWSALVGAIVTVLSLGPRLHIAGRVTGLVLPWRYLQPLPLLENVLPGRLAQYTALCVALIVGWWLQHLRTARLPARAVGGATVLASLVLLVPASPPSVKPLIEPTVPAFFATSAVDRSIPAGSAALVAPFPRAFDPTAMYWQVSADLRFAMPGGYVIRPGPGNHPIFDATKTRLDQTLVAYDLHDPRPVKGTRAQLLADLRALHPAAIMVGPMNNQAGVVNLLSGLVGRPPRAVGGVYLWVLHG